MFEFFEMPHFSYLILKIGKWGISKNKHVINFLTEKEPKMKFFDFGAFQKIRKILSREKYIFHMLFGVSPGTPCTWNRSRLTQLLRVMTVKILQ